MNPDLKKILQKLENRNGSNSGINITFDEKGIKGVRGNDGYTPIKGQDYFTEQEIQQIINIVRSQATPVKGKDYFTASEVAEMIRGIESRIRVPKDGKDGRDGKDGKDGETPDTRSVAIDAVTLLESFEGDARLSATALRDFEVALDEALKNPDFKLILSADQITGIKDLLPKYPPMNAGGSGATFLKSLRDVDLSGLTKNSDGKYVLGSGSGGSATFLNLTDTPSDYTGQGGKYLKVTAGEDGVEFVTLAGGGDMAQATYDPDSISEQLVGLTATQTLTNKTLTQPTITLKQGTAPTPTAEGDIQWDTDDNKIKVGDGAGTKTFSDDSVNAATYQPLATVLTNTTASFTTAQETKLAGIETGADVTDATNVNAAGAVMESDYNLSHSILVQQAGTGSPSLLQVPANSIVGNDSTGDIIAMTATQVRTLINVEDGADVTDATNVTAAGALMDSEVTDLAGIKALNTSTLQVKPAEGAFVDGDKTKLDGIEAGADVTDATNVASAGAIMDGDFSTNGLMKRTGAGTYATATAGTDYVTPTNTQDQDFAGYDIKDVGLAGFKEYDNGNSGASATINWNNGAEQKITLTANCTLTFTAPTGDTGNVWRLALHVVNASSYTLTLPTVKTPSGDSYTAGTDDIITLRYDGTSYYMVASQSFA